ncbi:MAG: hypothetical protein WCL44_04510 [bacterium]
MADFGSFISDNIFRLQEAEQLLPLSNPTFANPDFKKAKLRVLIVRLSPFRDVDRSTPHLFLADAARRAEPASYIDMCFLPLLRDRRFLIEAGVPLIMGMQSCRTADEFDVVLVSNAYTLELINLPYMLINSGIPVEAGKRDATWPPFIVGGSNAMCAHSIIREDGESFADAVFFGEGERDVVTILRTIRGGKRTAKRQVLTKAAAKVKGLWVAGAGTTAKATKNIVCDPSADDLPVRYPLLNSDAVGTAKLQVACGCPAFCAFCFEGFDRKPYREIPADQLVKKATELKASQGCSALDLYGFSVSDHTRFIPLFMELNRLFDSVTLKSQRMDPLLDCPQVVQVEVVGEKRTFTLGIEGISGRQRARLNKSLPTGTINGVLARLLKEPVREMKLFFVLTGTENEADLGEFRAFCEHLSKLRQMHRVGLRIIFSFGFLVRMPGTPMRYERLILERSEWTPIVEEVELACRDNGHEIRQAVSWTEYCVSQVMAIGGHWLFDVLAAMAAAGCCYDNRLDNRWWDWIKKWMMEKGYWNREFLGEKGPGYRFPLSFVDSGISGDFLYSMYSRSRDAQDAGHCLGRPLKRGRCLECGACVDPQQKKSLSGHAMELAPGRDSIAAFHELIVRKRRIRPVHAVFRLSPVFRGVGPAWANAYVFQNLLRMLPDQVDNLLSVEEQLFSLGENPGRFGINGGETVFALKAWDNDKFVRALSGHKKPVSDDVSFLRMEEDFKPGMFKRAQVDLALRVASPDEAGARLSAFLRATHLPVGFRREGDGYRLEIQGKGGKREVLVGGTYRLDGNVFEANFEIGPRFDLRAFVRGMCGGEGRPDDKIKISGLVF